MSYQRNGNCAKIMNRADFGTDFKSDLQIVGRVNVNRK